MKVYLSSTYEDLREQRMAVQLAVLQAGHHPVAMEQDVASELAPLKVCLEQLAECQLYIGLVAWRYGYVDDRRGKSITELEYLHAGKLKIPRLMFLLREDAPWPPRFVEHSENILRFRQQIEASHYRREFATTGELTREVVAAIGAYERRLRD